MPRPRPGASNRPPAEVKANRAPRDVDSSPAPALAGHDEQAVTRDGAVITPHRVFPPEDRVVYYPKYYPMSLIGRIFTLVNGKTVGGGTGVLIGRRHVLTVAHVCPWNAPKCINRGGPHSRGGCMDTRAPSPMRRGHQGTTALESSARMPMGRDLS